LVQSEKIKVEPAFDHWVRTLSGNKFFPTLDLTTDVILTAFRMPRISNPFDRLIMATAGFLQYPLVTKDDLIIRSGLVECLWDD
jgi:PIN domain nuclease of toxin-antitoxin system